MTELSEALRLTGAFKSSGGQQVPLKWANPPKPGEFIKELEATCERISALRTPVIIVPDEEIKAQAQVVLDEHGRGAEIIAQQEYWEQEAVRHRCAQFPSLPFELTPDPLDHTPRNHKERRHGRDY